MNKKFAGLIASIMFAVVTAGVFYWLYSTTSKGAAPATTTSSSYSVVEIESVKTEAVDILSGLENKSGIPVPTPTDKMGRVNPYLDY